MSINQDNDLPPGLNRFELKNYNYSNNNKKWEHNVTDLWKTKKNKMPVLWQKKPTKKNDKFSIGIACCRIKKNKPEILLIQKRYTYAYCEFVHGQYSLEESSNDLRNKFSLMTIEEKLDILTMDFDHIWFRVWLDSSKISAYFTSKVKFDTLIADGGIRLRKLIEKSKSINLIWEIPKGMKKRSETDLNAAVREFEEETNISKSMYKIFPDVKIKYRYTDVINYNVQYYIALTKKNIVPEINFQSKEQLKEISAIRWASIEDVRFLSENNKYLEQTVTNIFKIIKAKV
jgi:8-oxo-dGTP pyrophosphatase MutT (NUDIX family)